MPSAENGVGGHSGGPALCTLDEFLAQEYDYIVVGGGTAGLCVAARLTENDKVKVGVLEAGKNLMDDPQISTPSSYPTLIGREKYDWCFESEPVPTAGNKTYSMPRGRALGGSSAINYLMYVRGSRNDYDGWASLGNKGWGWDDMLPYFKKHQTLDPPEKESPNKQFMPAAAKEKYHGSNGPIHTSFNDYYEPFEYDFCEAAYATVGGQRTLHDAWSGDHMGFYSSLAAVNRTDDPGKRSYSATGYLRPNLQRPNLRVLTEALVGRVLLEGTTAKGVEFYHNGQKYQAKASKEIILSGGVINSPQILELSGIGDPKVLEAAGVECLVKNDRVGANFQDHVLGGMLYDLKDGINSLDALHGEEYQAAMQEMYNKTNNGPLGSPGMLMGFVSYASLVDQHTLNQTIADIRQNSLAKTDFEKRQEDVIVRQLSDPTFANLQIFCIGAQLDVSRGDSQIAFFAAPPKGKQRVSMLVCSEHPLSRGTVHITSPDPTKHPRIDPGYFRNPADAKILAEGIKWMDKVVKQPVMAKSLGERILPPQDAKIETEEERIEYVRNHISTQYHLIGTCTMGEVVDDTLKVKGVNGLRVIDASVFPGHVSGNIMSTTYAVAEKGADLVKADDERFR
ncbi:Non-catalytic module family CDH [Pseudocercospora fijiensis CIRAD86]|uniref:Non-catalytic module family CDH n=1 Tax=Pseudocercospora fijiensis (strain CIRAD86) TaxID=383855 RepID=M3AUG0_PSEFD|nr:Non-catalytic module family CDH [Pseudocercospora fijiensis CIRAD86]EME81122.1 Non-catalytic module family CDH [Pseudocercospora fijiensis CIRAD86]